jgi:hypothetical protein
MKRAIHLTVGNKDGCGSSTRHIGAYMGVALAEFMSAPAERKCARCLGGKLFEFVTRTKVSE